MLDAHSRSTRLPLAGRMTARWLEEMHVHVQGGRLIYQNLHGGPASATIPYLNLGLLFLGRGCSISTEAVGLLLKEGCHVFTLGPDGAPMALGVPTRSGSSRALQALLPAVMDPQIACRALRIASGDGSERMQTIGTRLAKQNIKPMKVRGTTPFHKACEAFAARASDATDLPALYACNAAFEAAIHAKFTEAAGLSGFQRIPQEKGETRNAIANRLIDHGEFLCLGAAEATLGSMGIPGTLSLNGGSSLRSLAQDLALSVAQAFTLPIAFGIAARSRSAASIEIDFREKIIAAFDEHCIFSLLEQTALSMAGASKS